MSKKAVRIITFSPHRCYSQQVFKDCSIMQPKQSNDLQLACFMYRCINKIMPSDLCKMFIVNSTFHSLDTRIKNKLHQDSHKLTLRSNTVRIASVLYYYGTHCLMNYRMPHHMLFSKIITDDISLTICNTHICIS